MHLLQNAFFPKITERQKKVSFGKGFQRNKKSKCLINPVILENLISRKQI